MKKNAMPVTTSVMSVSQAVLVVSGLAACPKSSRQPVRRRRFGGQLQPPSPPVQELNELRIAPNATAKASVIPAR